MKVKKRYLLIIAAIVWSIAGFNVLRIGLDSYRGNVTIFNILLSGVVFCLFWFLVFSKLVNKHTIRILNFKEDKQFIFNFFDKKSFIIMFLMMFFGILIRVKHLAPIKFIAFFYTGLGSALFLAGIYFLINYYSKGEK